MNINHKDTIAHHIPAPERHVDAPRSDWQTKLQEHAAAVERNDQLDLLLAKQKMLAKSLAITENNPIWNEFRKGLSIENERISFKINALRAQVAP